jgi:hypothetical protein
MRFPDHGTKLQTFHNRLQTFFIPTGPKHQEEYILSRTRQGFREIFQFGWFWNGMGFPKIFGNDILNNYA